jgi:hypothetical protein
VIVIYVPEIKDCEGDEQGYEKSHLVSFSFKQPDRAAARGCLFESALSRKGEVTGEFFADEGFFYAASHQPPLPFDPADFINKDLQGKVVIPVVSRYRFWIHTNKDPDHRIFDLRNRALGEMRSQAGVER